MKIESLSRVPTLLRRRILPPVLIVVYGAGFISAATFGLGLDASLSGVPLVVTRGLGGHFVALTCMVLQGLVGAELLARLGWSRPLRDGIERALFAWIAGFVVTSFALMLLAWAKLLNGGSVGLISIAAATACGASRLRGRRGNTRAAPDGARDGEGPRTEYAAVTWIAAILLLVVAVIWCWPLLVQTFLPNSDWDSALYHLPLATRYLEGHLWNPDPLFSAYSFPGGVSLVYAAFMSLGFESAVIPYNFLAVSMSLAAIAGLALRIGDRTAAAWAVLIAATTHILWQLGVDPRIDSFLCVFITCAVLAVCIWLEDRQRAGPLYLLALALGAAAATKYTGLFIGLAIAGVVFVLLAIDLFQRRLIPTSRQLALALLLASFPSGLWYGSNAWLHGDPLFPMLRGDYYTLDSRPGERLPTATALDPVLSTMPPGSPTLRRAAMLRGRLESEAPSNLFDLWALLQNPDAYAVKPNHLASPLLILFLALPFALPKSPKQRAAAWATWVIGVGCYVALASQTNLLRYVLPLLPLFAVGAAVVITRLPSRLFHGLVLFVALGILLANWQLEREKLVEMHPRFYAEVDADAVRWLERTGYNHTKAMPRMIRHVNEQIANGHMQESDLILMIGEGKGRLLDCRYLPDLSWFLQRWVVELVKANHQPDDVMRSLERQGVTHILYNESYFSWVLRKTRTPVNNLAYAMVQLEGFLRDHATRTAEVGGTLISGL